MTLRLPLTHWGGESNGTPLQYSCLENPMDGGAWWAAVHGVAKSRTQLSDFTFTFHFHTLKKEMATHSSVLAWRITGTAEPGGLPSMGSHRVRHNWSDLAAAAATHLGLSDLESKNKLEIGWIFLSTQMSFWDTQIACGLSSIPHSKCHPQFPWDYMSGQIKSKRSPPQIMVGRW